MTGPRRIFLLVPTRQVPGVNKWGGVMALHDSIIRRSADLSNVVLVLGLDDRPEDKPFQQHARDLAATSSLDVQLFAETNNCGGHWNKMSLRFPKRDDDLVMMCADDVIMDSPNWDTELLGLTESRATEHILWFGDDTKWNERFSTHPILCYRTVKTIGGLTTGRCWRANDTWLWSVFHLLDPGRIIYLSPVVTKHNYRNENPWQVQSDATDCGIYRNEGPADMARIQDALRADIPVPPPRVVRFDTMRFGWRYDANTNLYPCDMPRQGPSIGRGPDHSGRYYLDTERGHHRLDRVGGLLVRV